MAPKKPSLITTETSEFRQILMEKVDQVQKRKWGDRLTMILSIIGAVGVILGGSVYILDSKTAPIKESQKELKENLKERFEKIDKSFDKLDTKVNTVESNVKGEADLKYMMKDVARDEIASYMADHNQKWFDEQRKWYEELKKENR